MEEDFIYWRHPTLPGIKVEEVSGGGACSDRIWLEMARQLYCENGRENYRDIGHYHNGAPFLYGENCRISVTHCKGLLAVATLPSTPEVDLAEFSERAALGIDAERIDREQILGVRDKFLSEREKEMVEADDVKANILAWTLKEAAYKAALRPGLDFRNDIVIEKLPKPGPPTPVYRPEDFDASGRGEGFRDCDYGEICVAGEVRFRAFSYLSDECIVTLVYSPRCAKFGKSAS